MAGADPERSFLPLQPAVRVLPNYDISQAIKAGETIDEGVSPGALAAIMLALQDQGCHNVNFVTPEHVVPQIVEALALAIPAGLRLPLVYNTSAYDSLESLEFMDGLVDIYMPDFKYWSTMPAADISRRRIIRRWRVGRSGRCTNKSVRSGSTTMASRRAEVLIRHLVMPGGLDETRAILEWVAEDLGQDAHVNAHGPVLIQRARRP